MRIFDAFCSNGSTWIDKDFFKSTWVIKNDIRNGEYLIGNRQKIFIKPDTDIDMFKKHDKFIMLENFDIIYLDPPHSLRTTGIINEKYTHLPKDWESAINNMWDNVNKLAVPNTTIILKWNETGKIAIESIIKLAKANNIIPMFGSKVRTLTYWIVFRKGKLWK